MKYKTAFQPSYEIECETDEDFNSDSDEFEDELWCD